MSISQCWSGFGYKNYPHLIDMEPDEVAHKLVAGMQRNMQSMARLTGGEPTLHWEHLKGLVLEVLTRTEGQRMSVPGLTTRRGEPFGLIIETNGSLLPPKRLDELAELCGPHQGRVLIAYGIKATSASQLAGLTGQSIETAERFHREQMKSLMHAAYNTRLDLQVAFLDKFTDPRVFAGLGREIERARPGLGRHVEVFDFKNYSMSQRYYVPKHMRRERFPDGIPADDAETVLSIMPPEGGQRRPLEREEEFGEPDPVLDLEVGDLGEIAEVAQEYAAALQEQGVPEGTMQPGGA